VLKGAKANNQKATKIHKKICKGVCMERVSSMNGEEVYLSWETPGPGVSHVADDPPNSAHRHPNNETRTKREYGRQSGRVVTVILLLKHNISNEVSTASSERSACPSLLHSLSLMMFLKLWDSGM
jgi:hypothetical protein